MDFAAKLRRLGGPGPERSGRPGPERSGRPGSERLREPGAGATVVHGHQAQRLDALRNLIGDAMARSGPVSRLAAVEAEDATLHAGWEVRSEWLEPCHSHGRAPVRAALDVDAELLARLALDPCLERVDLPRMLLLDTETTGLAGGTGTIPFLIGLAFFEDASLCVEQLLLRRLGEERPLLERLAERLANASCIVTYNGKSFDWPLLRTRFILNRVPAPPLPPHVDLLHCARRVFKPRLENVRLTQVEAEVLGFVREQDVPGSEIPWLYGRYLRERDAALLEPVIEHNRHDVVALAALLGKLAAHFAEVCWQDDPRDHLAYAKVAERARDLPRAQRFVRAAIEGDAAQGTVAYEARMLAGRMACRTRDFQTAAEHWHAAIAAAPDAAAAAAAHLALAKLYEHRLRDYAAALVHASRTASAMTPCAETQDAQQRRLARLERRLMRVQQPSEQRVNERCRGGASEEHEDAQP